MSCAHGFACTAPLSRRPVRSWEQHPSCRGCTSSTPSKTRRHEHARLRPHGAVHMVACVYAGGGAVGRAPSASMRVRSCEVSTRVHSYDVFCLSSLCARDATLLLRCGCGCCCSAAPHKRCFRSPASILRRRVTLHVTARDAARRRAADAAPRRRRVQQGQLCEFSRRWVVKIIRAW